MDVSRKEQTCILRGEFPQGCLTDLFVAHGLGQIGVETLFIEPGSPWENGYRESSTPKLRNELLAGRAVLDPLWLPRTPEDKQ